MVYKCFDKVTSGGTVKNDFFSNKKLTEYLRKPIIGNFKKSKVHSSSVDNIWGADLADMQIISKFNKGFIFLLCVFGSYSKYAWVILNYSNIL